jgi:hypothetical protein
VNACLLNLLTATAFPSWRPADAGFSGRSFLTAWSRIDLLAGPTAVIKLARSQTRQVRFVKANSASATGAEGEAIAEANLQVTFHGDQRADHPDWTLLELDINTSTTRGSFFLEVIRKVIPVF